MPLYLVGDCPLLLTTRCHPVANGVSYRLVVTDGRPMTATPKLEPIS